MKKAIDIAWLSVPFTAGIGMGAILTGPLFPDLAPSGRLHLLATLSLPASAMLAGGLCIRRPKRLPVLMILFILTGLSCSLNSALTKGTDRDAGPISRAAHGSAERMKEIIDSIPYTGDATAGLVKALTTGDRSGLSKDTIQIFRKSGASHILALSGLHLGIIYMLLLWATAFLGHTPRAKLIRYILVIGFSFFYALATGASASIMRATFFIFLNETAMILCRRRKPLGVFCSALMIQLLISPENIGSVGFQLSYLAMLGIFLLFPHLKAWYPAVEKKRQRPDIPRMIWNSAALTLSCQVFTAPLVWIYFGTFPKYFLLTNLLALPVTTIVMVSSMGVILLSAAKICPYLAIRANELSVNLLDYILRVISDMS